MVFDTLILFPGEWEILTLPLPVEVTFAVVLFFVKGATCTDLLINDGHWLKSVGENDVRIHSCYIHVIDQWLDFVVWALAFDEIEFA